MLKSDTFLLQGVRRMGATALFFGRLLVQCLPALARPRLIVSQIYNTGARSLIIIMLWGCSWGWCWDFRADPAAAALWLRGGARQRCGAGVAEGTRSGDHRVAVRRPGRHGAHLGDRPDARHRSAHGDGDDGGQSAALRRRATLSGRGARGAAADGDLRRDRPLRGAADRCAADADRCGGILVADAGSRSACAMSPKAS